jgi:putative phage-type endonuclease
VTATLVGKFEHGSPEWHQARLGGIGGSEIAAVLGLSKWESHFSLWHRKLGRIPERPENPDQEWGTRLEPAILQKFADKHPELAVDVKPGTWRNDDRPWQIANPDALARPRRKRGPNGEPSAVPDSSDGCIVEAKNVNDRIAYEWDNGPPPYYIAQTRWYLDTFGLDRAVIAALFGGSDYQEFEIRPDPEDTALMREAGAAFMDSLMLGMRPDIDSHGATYEALRYLPDGVIDDRIEVDPELAAEYLDTIALAADWAERKTLVASKMLDAIGNYKGARVGNRHIATRTLRKGTNTTHSLRPARQL